MRAKKVEFDVTYVNLRDKPEWFLKLSPHGKVPVLQVGDEVLFESNAIVRYLAARYPAGRVLGIDLGQTLCFVFFWGLHVFFIAFGTESIRWLETLAAPFLILMGIALLIWAYVQAGGFGAMLSTPSAFGPGGEQEGQFWSVFFPNLTAMVGFWATLAPAAVSASILALAVPLPLVMIAPAWPIFLPGGAVTPAI